MLKLFSENDTENVHKTQDSFQMAWITKIGLDTLTTGKIII